jgi:threonine/homoserine/homoserine lactone efflux protein
MPDLTAFLLVAVVVIVTPGPDTALTIRNTLLGGRRSGLLTAVGVAAGQATWTIATAAGIAALLAASEPVFRAVRYAGAAYLAFLGVQALRAAARKRVGSAGFVAACQAPALAPSVALRQGLLSNLSNPKMVAFFPALLPQFVPPGREAFAVLLLLGFLFCSMTLAWLSAYAFAVAKAGALLLRGRVRRLLEAATGVVLIALGLRLAEKGCP